MYIKIDNLSGPEVSKFLEDHIEEMKSTSPPESKHALDIEGLKQANITFWSVWENDILVGCGALSELDPDHGEIKSMRTSPDYKRKGVASRLLQHIIDEALERGYKKLSLETGSMDFFLPARKLYENYGFTYCGPFSDYIVDPYSVFMTKDLINEKRGHQ